MKANLPYDGNLQMFVESVREPSREALDFLRWLAEHDRLEHSIAGPSSGAFARQSSVATSVQAPSTTATVPTHEAKRVSWYAGSGE